MVPQREISKAAERDRIPERTVEKDYVIHWTLLGLGTTAPGRHLAFKGGTALRLCYFRGYRYSEDVDLTALEPMAKDEAFRAFSQAAEWVRRESAIETAILPDSYAQHTDGFSFKVGYSGPLGARVGHRSIKIDVSNSELVLFPVERRPVIRHYSDIPRKPAVCCYALDEMVAEKFRSLLNRARREPRDLYDLWYLLERGDIDVGPIRDEFRTKAEFKKLLPATLPAELARKKAALAALWESRLAHQVGDLPLFEAAFKRVSRAARNLLGA